MNISYNEFHISRKIRNLCSFNEGLYASSGNVIFANMKNVRDFQLLFNNIFITRKFNISIISDNTQVYPP